MTDTEIFKTQLWQEFEAVVKAENENPINVLSELMNDYIEFHTDSALFEEIEEEGFKSGYTEEDAIELVRQARLDKMRG
jgi:hypothetical protein